MRTFTRETPAPLTESSPLPIIPHSNDENPKIGTAGSRSLARESSRAHQPERESTAPVGTSLDTGECYHKPAGNPRLGGAAPGGATRGRRAIPIPARSASRKTGRAGRALPKADGRRQATAAADATQRQPPPLVHIVHVQCADRPALRWAVVSAQASLSGAEIPNGAARNHAAVRPRCARRLPRGVSGLTRSFCLNTIPTRSPGCARTSIRGFAEQIV